MSAPLAGRALGQRRVLPLLAAEAFAWTFTVITAGMSAGSACGGLIIQT